VELSEQKVYRLIDINYSTVEKVIESQSMTGEVKERILFENLMIIRCLDGAKKKRDFIHLVIR
jgi:hypothetical protein